MTTDRWGTRQGPRWPTAVIAVSLAVALSACGSVASPFILPSVEASAEPSVPATQEPSVAPSPTPYQHVLAASPNPELREELLLRQVADQMVRGIPPPEDSHWRELYDDPSHIDDENVARITEILDELGWPGWSLVGEDGSSAAWLLVQHADLDLPLQKRGLEMLRAAAEAGDASRGDLAYLTDRVLVAEGQPQVYGTQIRITDDGEIVPATPIADPDSVEALRAEAGLQTLEEYYQEIREVFAEEFPEPSP